MIKVRIFNIIVAILAMTTPLYAEILNDEKQRKNYPNFSGDILFEIRNDNVLSSKIRVEDKINTFVNIEPDISLNFNKNISLKTAWRIYPVTQRSQQIYPERNRTILNQNRGFFNLDDTGLIVEELKINFENEDMKFYAGKFNPQFGTMHRRNKKLGSFNTDFTEDYELRERLGMGVVAIFENSELSINTFFNDDTALSESAIKDRGRLKSSYPVSGNTSTLSSYSIALEGKDAFNVKNLFYNIGYRSLGVDKNAAMSRETGVVAGLEYLIQHSEYTSFLPVIEIARLNNFSGYKGRDALYINTGFIAKYSRWSAGFSTIVRRIDQKMFGKDLKDYQYQLFVGYKFNDKLSVDITRANIKEDGNSASLIGVLFTYVEKF